MNNIYIYFASEDNQPQANMENGWVSSFQVFLETMLGQLTHFKPNVKLMDNDDIENVDTIKDDGLLICVLSPAFVNSGSVTQNFGVVYKAFETHNKKSSENGSIGQYIYKVVKSPVALDRQPIGLQKILDYKFFHLEGQTGTVEEFINFESFFTTEAEKTFWLSMADLTYDILETFKKHNEGVNKTEMVNDYVYLSETGYDLAMERITIKRELQRHGYKILPDKALPRDQNNLEKRIKEDLSKSMLSVHLFGEDYGEEIEGTDYSNMVLQNRLAAKHALDLKESTELNTKFPFSRFVWIHPELKFLDERQKYYLDTLQRRLDEQHGAEILLTRLEDYKTSVLNHLKTKKPKQTEESHTEKKKKEDLSIYLITDKRDAEAAKPLISWLEDQGYRVMHPSFDTKNTNARIIHQGYLNACDALILFFGKAKEEWLLAKLQDILKSPGMGRDNPLLNKAIFTDSEENVERLNNVTVQNKQHQEALIILNKGEFSPDALQSFLLRVKESSDKS